MRNLVLVVFAARPEHPIPSLQHTATDPAYFDVPRTRIKVVSVAGPAA